MLYTVIAKPTKACNADCSYCSSPPDDAEAWSVSDFQVIFDRIAPRLADEAVWIWHGGEPMLQSPEFYRACRAHVDSSIRPNVKFSIQSNLLLYKSSRWRDIFEHIFEGSISTSFDPDEKNRTIKGDAATYSRTFYRKLEEVCEDGFSPLVIGTYSEDTAPLMDVMYERAMASSRPFNIRFNYRYPAGRALGEGAVISPETYGRRLIELYNRWMSDRPDFYITPLNQMFLKVIGSDVNQCPWTKACGGRFIGIEPNGDAYNCGEFADLQDERYRFGNLKAGTLAGSTSEQIVRFIQPAPSSKNFADALLQTPGARAMRRRQYDLPMDCKSCRHFDECEGGCMRDAELYGRGLGGKFFYCASWKMVFDRIKSSVLSGEADWLIERVGVRPEDARAYVRGTAQNLGTILRYMA